MRAVNNTLREIILRERPLTVTNNDSLVLSPPLPLLPLFASLSIHPFAPPSTCLSTLFLFTPRDLVYMPLYCMGATLYETLPSSTSFATRRSLESSKGIYIQIQSCVRTCKYKPVFFFIFASSLVRRPLRHDEFYDPRLEKFFFSAVPSRASKLIRSTGSVNAITTSACIQRGTDVTVVA